MTMTILWWCESNPHYVQLTCQGRLHLLPPLLFNHIVPVPNIHCFLYLKHLLDHPLHLVDLPLHHLYYLPDALLHLTHCNPPRLLARKWKQQDLKALWYKSDVSLSLKHCHAKVTKLLPAVLLCLRWRPQCQRGGSKVQLGLKVSLMRSMHIKLRDHHAKMPKLPLPSMQRQLNMLKWRGGDKNKCNSKSHLLIQTNDSI